MPYHEFVVYKKKPNYFTNFSKMYLKQKNMVKVSDEFIYDISFYKVETYFHYYRKKCKKKGLALLGITIIPPESLEQFQKIIKSHNKNNEVINELIKLTEEAKENDYFIIHYGI